MKAERRHELRESDLLHVLESARDYITENGSKIFVVLIVILAAIAAVSYGIRTRIAAYEDIWRRRAELKFDDVETGRQSLQALDALTAETKDNAFVLSSLIEQGRQALKLSQDVPFPPDLELNGKAHEAFDQLLERFPNNPLAIGIAHLGLATVAENEFAFDHDLSHKEEARSQLAKVVEDSRLGGFPFQRLASERLESLDQTFSETVFQPPTAPEEVLESPESGSTESGVDSEDQVDVVDDKQP